MAFLPTRGSLSPWRILGAAYLGMVLVLALSVLLVSGTGFEVLFVLTLPWSYAIGTLLTICAIALSAIGLEGVVPILVPLLFVLAAVANVALVGSVRQVVSRATRSP